MTRMSALFEHTQRFVCEVFSDCLSQEGFTSYKGEGIHWYRIVNGEVVHAVYFITRHASLQSSFEICYGCHPLYIPPVFQKSPYMYALPGYEQMNDAIPETVKGSTPYGMESLHLIGMYNRPYRIPDSMILCPKDKNNGLDILEKLLPVMNRLSTPYACYEMHKNRRHREIINGNTLSMSSYFADEVLAWEDLDLYPFCKEYVAKESSCLEKLLNSGDLKRKADREHLNRLLGLRNVFEQNARDLYMQELYHREQKNLRQLMKHCGWK